jgi:hypothetical protein
MPDSASWRVRGVHRPPTISVRIVPPARRWKTATTRSDHFGACPYCRVNISVDGRIADGRGCPGIRGWIISCAGIEIGAEVSSTPDNHFTAGPDRRVTGSGGWRVRGARRCPSVRHWVVPPARVKARVAVSAPNNHFTAGPDGGVLIACRGRVNGAGGGPTVRCRVVSPAGVRLKWDPGISAPNYHFTASPNGCVKEPLSGRTGRAGGCPTIRHGIISPAGVVRRRAAINIPAPNNHFVAGPDCGMPQSRSWRVRGIGRYPTIIGRIVPASTVQMAVTVTADRKIAREPTPDDHFVARPYCRMILTGFGRTADARGHPCIISAAHGLHRG